MAGGCFRRVSHASRVVFHPAGVQQGEVAVGGWYTITVLENELPRAYSTDLYKQKCDALYQHVYEA
jgi:hypothetical protein